MTTNTSNQTINGSSRNDDLEGGRGNDTIRGYAGNDEIEGEGGNDLLDGGDGNDELDGDDGNDTLLGGAGDDDLEGGDGDDVLDGGSGRDKMDGGDGNDTFIFRFAEHTGTPTGKESDAVRVDGDDGIDTLQLVLTRAEWLRADVQADVKNLLAFIAQRTKSNGEVTGANFDFNSVDLRVEEVEKVVIVVDGLAIDARDEAVTARGDVITATEDAASVVVNLLANDSVPDLVKSVTVTQGAHGTVVLTTNYANPAAPQANVVYTPNSSYYQYLAAGERATDTFSYTVTDADGDVSTATVTVTITGVNDGPLIVSGKTATALTEGATVLTDTGTILFSDVDLSDTHTVSVGPARVTVSGAATNVAPAGGFGTLTALVNENTTDQNNQGNIVWTFRADDAQVTRLAAGQTATQVYTLTLTDRTGATVTKDVTVTLTGTNDAPTVTSAVSTGATVEDGTTTATGTIAFADADIADTHNVAVAARGNGYVGTLVATITDASAGDGAGTVRWNFAVDNAAIQGLAKGQVLTQSYTVTVTDTNGAKVDQVVTITVTGANDAAVIGVPTNASVQEDVAVASGKLVATGTIAISDVDQGEAYFVSHSGAAGNAGTLAFQPNGSYVYSVDNAAVQYLAAGETRVDSFTVVARDGTSKVVQFTITGSNDAPVVTSTTAAAAGAVREAGNVDAGAIDAGTPSATGLLTSSDVDTGATATWSGSRAGTYGAFAIGANGAWTYTLNNGAATTQALAEGDSRTETFTATVTDDRGATATQVVTVTVTGTNDSPIVTSNAAAAAGTVREAGNLDAGAIDAGTPSATGTLTSSDVDTGATATWSGTTAGTYGAFAITAGGVWTYTIDNGAAATAALAEGQTRTETFTATVTDDRGATAAQVVTITVTGTNDSPIVTSAASAAQGAIVEAGNADDGAVVAGTPSAAGMLTSSDVDTGATATWSGSAAGSYGAFAITAGGAWTYAIDNGKTATQALREGQTVTETFSATVTDDRGAFVTIPVVITVTGTNDVPVAVADTGATNEDSVLTGSVATNDSDVDAGAVLSYALVGTVPGLTIAGNGGYSFNAGVPAYQALKAGETQDVVAIYAVTDENGAVATSTLTVRVTGTNDAPVVTSSSADVRGTVTEAGNTDAGTTVAGTPSVGGTLTSSDVDHDATATWSGSAAGTYGAFTIGAGGVWSYALDNARGATQALAEGETRTETFTATVTDDFGATATQVVTVTVIGTNDSPVITSAATAASGAVREAGNFDAGAIDAGTPSATGVLTSSDVDAGATATWSGGEAGTYGGFAITAGGAWTYTIDNTKLATQALREGELVTETFTARVTDDRGAFVTIPVTITVTGTNDAPVAVADTAAGTENAALTVDVLANDSDVDGGAAFTLVAATAPAAKGVATIADNKVLFTPGTDFDHLKLGATETVVVAYTMRDEFGAAASSTLTITVTGTNDAPVAVADLGSSTENQILTIDVLANDTDVDDGASFTLVGATAPAAKGVASIVDNRLVFTPGADFDHLKAGATEVVTVAYTMADENGATSASTLTITVTGTNDAPVAVADLGASTENQILTIDVLANDTDVDDDHVFTLTGAVAPTGKGVASIVGNALVFTPSTDFDHLKAGAIETAVVTYTMRDENGATSASTLTITITGTNDAPVAVFDVAAGTENQSLTVDVLANDTDVDDDAVLTLTGAAVAPNSGSVQVVDNRLVFTPGTDFDHLALGATADVVVFYNIKDGQGGVSAATLTITVTGTNDAPVAVADTNAATEDTTVTGSVATNDSDVDDGAVLSYALVGTVPGLTIAGNGSYSFNAGVAAYQALKAGETQDVVATYRVTDENGASATATLTIRVTGTNDAPVVTSTAAAARGTVVEAGNTDPGAVVTGTPSVGGTLTSSDVDHDATATWSGSAAGTYGAFAITAGGAWTYTLDNTSAATQGLAEGQTRTETFTTTVTDDQGATATQVMTVTVVGTNDSPVVTSTAAAAQGAVVEAGNNDNGSVLAGVATATGTLTSSDVDAGATATWTGNTAGTYGSFAITAGGVWTYTLDNSKAATQSLSEGVTVTETFTARVADDKGAFVTTPVTVTITGSNDAPVITSSGPVTTVDFNQTSTALNGTGTAYSEDGLTFTPLSGNHLHFDYDVDGDAKPELWHHGVVEVTKTGGGKFTLTELDAIATPGGSGTYTLTAYTRDANNNLVAGGSQTVPASGHVILTSQFNNVDAVRWTAASSPNGFNYSAFDNIKYYASSGGTTAGSLTEIVDKAAGENTAMLTTSGTIAYSDVDTLDTHSAAFAANVTGYLGIFALGTLSETTDTVGWTFSVPDSGIDYLGAGQTLTQTYTVTIADDKGASANQVVTITITGTNDAPVVSGVVIGAAIEDGPAVALNALANATDADANAVLAVVSVPATLPPGVSYNATTKTFTLDPSNAAYQALAQGATQQVIVGYGVSDGTATTAASVRWTVTGTNDAPVAVADTRAATEDTVVTGSVATNDSDVDSGAVLGYTLDAPVAGLTLNGTGSYSFDAGNAAYQALAAGQTQTVVANYTVRDAEGATAASTLTITVTGTNDAPIVASAANTPVVEGGASNALSALARASDVDAGTTLVVTNLPATLPAGVTYDAVAKSFTIDPANAAYNSLRSGATQTVTVSYGISDGTATVPASVSWTVTGTNDAPVATLDFVVTAEDTAGISGNVIANDSDVDVGDTLSIASVRIDPSSGIVRSATAGTALQGVLGTLTVNADGSYSYALDNGNPTVQALAAGSATAEQFLYTLSDGAGGIVEGRLTISITGANDAPVVTGAVTATVAEGAAASTLYALANASDVDTGALLSVVDLPGTLPAGVTYDAAAKTLSLDPTNAAYNALAAGTSQTVSVSYGVSDGTATTPASVSWTVTGTNDAPVAVADAIAATEDTTVTGSVATNDSDVDAGAVLTYSLNAPVAGLTLNGNGSYSFDAGNAAYQVLAAGQTQNVVANYTVTDDKGATAISALTVTVTGANDAPNLVKANDGFVLNAANGHAYKVVAGANVWETAVTQAEAMGGYLATATSAAENAFIRSLGSDWSFLGANKLGDGIWNWATGPDAGILIGGANFASFDANEGNGAGEDYLLSLNMFGGGTWHDVNNGFGSVLGYVVERVGDFSIVERQDGSAGEGTTAADIGAGSLSFTDIDTIDTHSASFAAKGAGYLGTFAVSVDQAADRVDWTFNVADNALDSMAYGEERLQSYDITVSDGKGGTSMQTITVALLGSNDGPVAVADTIAATEDTTVTFNLRANDTDVDAGAVLTVTQINGAAIAPGGTTTISGGTLTMLANGNFSYAPAANANGAVTFGYTVSDEFGATSTANATINVAAVNDAPIAVNDSTLALVGQTKAIAVLANDGDVDGDVLMILGTTSAAKGTISVVGDVINYTPNAGVSGTDTFTYTVKDVLGLTSTATVTVTLDRAPIAVTDTYTINTGATAKLAVTTNDTDPDNDAVTLVSSGAGAHGTTIVNTDNTVSYTPTSGYVGTDSFTYVISDGRGGTATGTVNLTVKTPETAVTPTLVVGSNTVLQPTEGSAIKTTLVLKAGDVMTFDWNFVTDDYAPYKDFAFATVNGQTYSLSNTQATGDYGATGWNTFTFKSDVAGTYVFGQGVMNDRDASVESYLAIDAIRVNGAIVQSFENGLGATAATGQVAIVTSGTNTHAPVTTITPTNGSYEAFMTSQPTVTSALETFLGLSSGSLANTAKSLGLEYQPIVVPVSVKVAATAHPDETYATISGAPAGSTFNHGTYNTATNTWKVDISDLGGNLTITTPSDYVGQFTLSVTATSRVYGSNTSATSAAQSQVVTVNAAAVEVYAAPSGGAIKGGTLADTLHAGAGQDVFTGGTGNDKFVFEAGKAAGDTILDFLGNGTAAGDRLVFQGFGTVAQGATFVQIDSTHWQVNSADGTRHELITFSNAAPIDPTDYSFI